MAELLNLTNLIKTDVTDTHYLLVADSSKNAAQKYALTTLFPSVVNAGTGETIFKSLTAKNQINLKNVKSGDTSLLTVATVTDDVVFTVLESGIDLSLCNNTTSEFLSGVDFTTTVTSQCPVVNGGTGLSTIAKGAMLYASDVNTIAATAVPVNGQVLIGNATTGIPAWATLSDGDNVTIDETAGAITINANLSNLAANLDLYDGSATTYHIDTHSGTGFISGSGLAEGLTVDGDGKVFIGEGTPTAFFNDALNIHGGGIRFGNTVAVTVRPNTTSGATNGQNLTLGAGDSVTGSSGDLNLDAGDSSSSGSAGNVVISAGESLSGTDGQVEVNVAGAAQALVVTSLGDVVVGAKNLRITGAANGIVHENSGTVTQTASHSTNVTMHTRTGIIQLFEAVLEHGAAAFFTVSNDTVRATDLIFLQIHCPASGEAVENATMCAQVANTTDGSFTVRLSNPGHANTSESVHKLSFFAVATT